MINLRRIRRERREQALLGRRAGNAGIIASFVIALAGVLIGAVSAYLGKQGAAARAERLEPASVVLREAPLLAHVYNERDEIIRRVLAGGRLERLTPPSIKPTDNQLPKVIIIFDDMGIDKAAYDKAIQLPGPLTFSFLPYAKDVARLAADAREKGATIMLHLPMEPEGSADPGPKALRTGMTGAEFVRALTWNLERFDGYVGVNNHMGSRLTADEAAMKTILGFLKQQGVFFLDSVTTGGTVVRDAGVRTGATVFSRDVFLDAQPNDKNAIRKQLSIMEKIARETGYVVAICHPRAETLEVLGPWLASAPARGFELAPVTALEDIQTSQLLQAIMEQAPGLRG